MAGLFSKIFKAFANPGELSGNNVHVYLRCGECGRLIDLRLRKSDEIQRNLENNASTKSVFFVNKHVVDGNSRCRNRMDIRVEFDETYSVTNRILLSGKGEFISEDEYREFLGEKES